MQQPASAGGGFEGSLRLIDLDQFKRINNLHGHAAGDKVPVELARRLRAALRDDGLTVRWGGEEFLICMPGVGASQAQTQAQALALAERVLQAVAGKPVPLPGAGAGAETAALRVTVSVGYGAFPRPPASLPLTLERAINLADMALCTAKGEGRNRAAAAP